MSSSSVSSVPDPHFPVGFGRSRISRTEKPVFVLVPKDMTRGKGETGGWESSRFASAMIQPLQPVKEEQTAEGLGP